MATFAPSPFPGSAQAEGLPAAASSPTPQVVQQPDVLTKRCLNCKKLFGRKKLKTGFTETPSVFAKKRFCSHTCSGVFIAAEKRAAAAAVQA